MTTTQAAAPKTEPVRKLNARELNELRDEYDNNQRVLAELREEAKKLEQQLDALAGRETQAKKLLALSEDIVGFSTERERAQWVLEQCAEQQPHLQRQLDGKLARIKHLEHAVKDVDPRKFAKCDEIRKLANQLGI